MRYHKLSTELLLEAYQKAINLRLSRDFIFILNEELVARNIKLKNMI
ncbi:sporulation histidine kinase inhibitor Sda [Jeotgalibacillus soli]|uniref:Sporulation protein n=1 Tax=Jeotgalibacillus soli TaxID=889306 RepID=A0A0C2VA04_9BACL|nr:sporulation histidine kinase inhibitor Sda [Jeotgalibacillus soli]KIL45797.1 hypothetical protein KP78_21460 [Jeotgalibacillus soli]